MAKKKRITAYYRVSTKAEEQESSFHNQPEYFRGMLKLPEFKDYEEADCGFFYDYGITGTKLKRDGFIKMLEAAGLRVEKKGYEDIPHPKYKDKTLHQSKLVVSIDAKKKPKFDEIWIKSTSRFSRNINAYDILDTLIVKGVYVRFLDTDTLVDSQSKLAAVRKKMDEDMAFSENLSRNMRIAIAQRKERNGVVGLTYGYDYHPRTKTTQPYYTINDREAFVVRYLFERSAEGIGVRIISKELAEKGYFTRKGKPFGSTSLGRMLQNEKYRGDNFVGKYTNGTLFHRFSNPQIVDSYETKPSDDVPPIVSAELWDKANKEHQKRSTHDSNERKHGIRLVKHPFSDLLVCGFCGNHFVFDYCTDYSKSIYRCSTKRTKGVSACSCMNVRQIELDEFIKELENGGLCNLIFDSYKNDIITTIVCIKQYIDAIKNPEQSSEIEKRLTELRNTLENASKRKAVILNMLSDTSLSDEGLSELESTYKSLDIIIVKTREEIEVVSRPKEEHLSRIAELFSIADEILTDMENCKATYTQEEVMEKLQSIIVNRELKGGCRLKHGAGPKGIIPNILIPRLKTSARLEQIKELANTEIEVKIRDHVGEFDPEEGHPFDYTDIGLDEFSQNIKEHLKNVKSNTKSKWAKTTIPKILLADIQNILPNMGFENQIELDIDGIKQYLASLKTEYTELIKQ